jgi:hypothetical protein
MTLDYALYANLDAYIFEEVNRKFHSEKAIDAFDLVSIFIWKAERSKTKLAYRLIKQFGSLDSAAKALSASLSSATCPEERLSAVIDTFGFYLPMASTIVSVLWPLEFTIYDVRVCEILKADGFGDFDNLKNLGMKSLWPRYVEYLNAVKKAVPGKKSFREMDQYLWGKSAALQLKNDLVEWHKNALASKLS